MAQIGCKLPSEAKPRMLNCDLGYSFFMVKGRIRFYCGSYEKTSFYRTRSGREIRAFWPLSRKKKFNRCEARKRAFSRYWQRKIVCNSRPAKKIMTHINGHSLFRWPLIVTYYSFRNSIIGKNNKAFKSCYFLLIVLI